MFKSSFGRYLIAGAAIVTLSSIFISMKFTAKLLQTSSRTTRSVTAAREAPNYQFYKNEISSEPDGNLIDVIHKEWHGNHQLLEAHHGYIQWLFPVFENAGMNWRSEALTKAEAKEIREDLDCAKRVIKSYQLMLHFYGMELVDPSTGEIKRGKNWKSRYQNLSTHTHNFLRISRIITSLGELGFARYKRPFVEHLQKEIEDGILSNCKSSFEKFWLPLLDEKTKWYVQKTLETEADREDSVYFKDSESSDSQEEMSQ